MHWHLYSVLSLLLAICCASGSLGALNYGLQSEVELFVPWGMDVPINLNADKPTYDVHLFKSPILFGTDDVMITFGQAYYKERGVPTYGIVSKHICTKGTNWARNVHNNNYGGNWKTQLVYKRHNYYPSELEKPIAVAKGNKIYVLSVIQKKVARGVDWDFALSTGEINTVGVAKGKCGTITWNTSSEEFAELGRRFKSPLMGLVPRHGSAILMSNGVMVFAISAKRGSRDVFVTLRWNGTGHAVDLKICSYDAYSGFLAPSMFEWGGKLIMNIHYQNGSYRLRESSDLGKTRSEAVGTLSLLKSLLKDKKDFTPVTVSNKRLLLFTQVAKPDNRRKPLYKLILWVSDGVSAINVGAVSTDPVHSYIPGGLYAKNGELFAFYQKSYFPSNFVLIQISGALNKIKNLLKDQGAAGDCISRGR